MLIKEVPGENSVKTSAHKNWVILCECIPNVCRIRWNRNMKWWIMQNEWRWEPGISEDYKYRITNTNGVLTVSLSKSVDPFHWSRPVARFNIYLMTCWRYIMKIRRSHDRLIFIMEIPIFGERAFILRWALVMQINWVIIVSGNGFSVRRQCISQTNTDYVSIGHTGPGRSKIL